MQKREAHVAAFKLWPGTHSLEQSARRPMRRFFSASFVCIFFKLIFSLYFHGGQIQASSVYWSTNKGGKSPNKRVTVGETREEQCRVDKDRLSSWSSVFHVQIWSTQKQEHLRIYTSCSPAAKANEIFGFLRSLTVEVHDAILIEWNISKLCQTKVICNWFGNCHGLGNKCTAMNWSHL